MYMNQKKFYLGKMSEKWLKRFMLNCSGDLSEFFGKKIISGHFCVFPVCLLFLHVI